MRNKLLFLFVAFAAFAFSQTNKIDSLNKALAVEKTDTHKVSLYIRLVNQYFNRSEYKPAFDNARKGLQLAQSIHETNKEAGLCSLIGSLYMETSAYDSSAVYYQKCLALRLRLGDKKWLAAAYNNFGNLYLTTSKFKDAIDYYNKSLELREEINDRFGMAVAYGNLGNVYGSQSNYPEALQYLFKALKLKEKLLEEGDPEISKESLAKAYTNIGLIYQLEEKYAEALSYHAKAIKIREEDKDRSGMAESYNSLGNIYYNKKDFTSALSYFDRSLALKKAIGDESGEAEVLNNIAVIHIDQKLYGQALQELKTCAEIDGRLGNEESLLNIDLNYGTVYYHQKKYKEAEEVYLKALKASGKFGIIDDLKLSCKGLYDVYKASGKKELALHYYEKFILYRDSISNEEASNKIVRAEMNYEFEKKEASVKAAHEKETALAAEEKDRQRVIIYGVSALLLLALGFGVYAYRSNLQRKRTNRELDIKNKKIENAYAIIEEKNKEVTDSIHYAKRIQRAMITSDSYISQHLADYFIFYQPKDIVSGDFYWAVKHGGKFYFIIADCTGHGVPGAFMSLLNISFLNEIVIERNILRPDEILDEQRRHIIKALNPTGSENSKDGMDCVLACFDGESGTLEYAAANNSFYIVRKGELLNCKADKMPVGKGEDERPFTYNKVQLESDDMVYLFTDGFADQFGGPKGKKYKYKQLEEKLVEVSGMSMKAQQEALKESFQSWKGNLEQVDDVLLAGIRIS